MIPLSDAPNHQANRYLADVYLPHHNAEFVHVAPEEGSAFVPLLGVNLDEILCEQHDRTVGKDNCVRFEGRVLQILGGSSPLPLREGHGEGASPH